MENIKKKDLTDGDADIKDLADGGAVSKYADVEEIKKKDLADGYAVKKDLADGKMVRTVSEAVNKYKSTSRSRLRRAMLRRSMLRRSRTSPQWG